MSGKARDLAQQRKHLLGKHMVMSSIPVSKKRKEREREISIWNSGSYLEPRELSRPDGQSLWE